MLPVFYVAWTLLMPMALWAAFLPASYFKTFRSLIVPGLWFVRANKVDTDGPFYVRILGVLLLVVVAIQVYVICFSGQQIRM